MDFSFWSNAKNHELLWPKGIDGQDEKAELLLDTFDSPSQVEPIISLLSAYQIPCFKYYDKEGAAGKIINGFSGYGVSIYVPASKLGIAKELLSAEPIMEEENEL